MLVLKRKSNQTIVIDDQIEITILKVKGNTVSLGIEAPPNNKVLRGELVGKQRDKDCQRSKDSAGTDALKDCA